MNIISEKKRPGRWVGVHAVVLALGGAYGGCAAETDATEDDEALESELAGDEVEVESKLAALSANAPKLFINNFGTNAGGWDATKHLRFVEEVSGDKRADVVGFGTDGVWVAISNGNSFGPLVQQIPGHFGAAAGAGGWDVKQNPRFLADINNDGKKDIIGFGNADVWVAVATSGGAFSAPSVGLANAFGGVSGGWDANKHPRLVGDVNGDGRADLVGFGNGGVYVALARSDGFGFGPATLRLGEFGYNAGGWRVAKHPRFLADVNGDGRADVVGFGDDGVYVATSKKVANNGTWNGLNAGASWVAAFGHANGAGQWRTEHHPRVLADVNGDKQADVVGFADDGTYVALSNGNKFHKPKRWIAEFGRNAGGWKVASHLRLLADVDGDGLADVVGFGDAATYFARSNGNNKFNLQSSPLVENFGVAQGWTIAQHPRFVTRVNGGKTADIVGFGNDGVLVSRVKE